MVVEIDAVPPLTGDVPRMVEPALNWTEPGAAGGVTVAVSVTDVPANWGLAGVAERIVVVEATGSTVYWIESVEDS